MQYFHIVNPNGGINVSNETTDGRKVLNELIKEFNSKNNYHSWMNDALREQVTISTYLEEYNMDLYLVPVHICTNGDVDWKVFNQCGKEVDILDILNWIEEEGGTESIWLTIDAPWETRFSKVRTTYFPEKGEWLVKYESNSWTHEEMEAWGSSTFFMEVAISFLLGEEKDYIHLFHEEEW